MFFFPSLVSLHVYYYWMCELTMSTHTTDWQQQCIERITLYLKRETFSEIHNLINTSLFIHSFSGNISFIFNGYCCLIKHLPNFFDWQIVDLLLTLFSLSSNQMEKILFFCFSLLFFPANKTKKICQFSISSKWLGFWKNENRKRKFLQSSFQFVFVPNQI